MSARSTRSARRDVIIDPDLYDRPGVGTLAKTYKKGVLAEKNKTVREQRADQLAKSAVNMRLADTEGRRIAMNRHLYGRDGRGFRVTPGGRDPYTDRLDDILNPDKVVAQEAFRDKFRARNITYGKDVKTKTVDLPDGRKVTGVETSKGGVLGLGQVEVGGVGVIRPGDYTRNKAALDEIRSGRVSYDPRAIKGLSDDLAKAYGQKQSAGIDAALLRAGADSSFKRADNWDKLSRSARLKAYADHLASGVGDTKSWTAADEKEKWRQDRRLAEATRRRDVADITGRPAPPMPTRGGLGFETSGGYSGPNGQPFQAGSPNQRGVKEFARAKGREQTDAAAQRMQHYHDWIAAQREDSAYASHLIRNGKAIREKQSMIEAKQRMESAQRRMATHYYNQAAFAAEQDLAGLQSGTAPAQGQGTEAPGTPEQKKPGVIGRVREFLSGS